MRLLRLAAAATAVVCLAPAAASASARLPGGVPASPTVVAQAGNKTATFGAGPANEHGPDGRTVFTYYSSPGGQLEDHLAVLNLTHHPETLRVYSVDVVSGGAGQFVYPPRSTAAVAAGTWLAVGTPHASGFVHAAPRSTTILPVRLSVPATATPGDHVAAIIVSLTGVVKGRSGQRVNLEQRVATRVLVRVSGTLRPQLSVEKLQASYSRRLNPFAAGSVTVQYTVRNTGNAILGGSQQVEVRGLFGSTSHAGSLPAIPTLLPGGTYQVTAHVLGVFPEISMTAHVRVTPAGLSGDVNPGLTAVAASTHFWAVPWILIALIVVLVVGAVATIRRRRRHRPERVPDAKTPQGVAS